VEKEQCCPVIVSKDYEMMGGSLPICDESLANS